MIDIVQRNTGITGAAKNIYILPLTIEPLLLMGSVSVRNISKMSYDSCPYSCMDTSVIRTMEGRSVTSRHNRSQISGSQQSCLTEMTQRWPFALSNDERKVTGFRFVPD